MMHCSVDTADANKKNIKQQARNEERAQGERRQKEMKRNDTTQNDTRKAQKREKKERKKQKTELEKLHGRPASAVHTFSASTRNRVTAKGT